MKINELDRRFIDAILNKKPYKNNANSDLYVTKKMTSFTDTLELSSSGQQLLSNQKALDSLTHIKGEEIKELHATNNELVFENGSYYRFTMNGYSTLLAGGEAGYVGLPILELQDELGTETILSEQEHKKSSRIERFFSALAGSSAGLIGSWEHYSRPEKLEILKSAGIEPGWFTIQNGSKANTFYLREDGLVLPEYQMESSRRGLNKENLFEIGYTKGETLTVNGVEYAIDDTGHVNIPKEVPVFPSFFDGNIEQRYSERKRQVLLDKNPKIKAEIESRQLQSMNK